MYAWVPMFLRHNISTLARKRNPNLVYILEPIVTIYTHVCTHVLQSQKSGEVILESKLNSSAMSGLVIVRNTNSPTVS